MEQERDKGATKLATQAAARASVPWTGTIESTVPWRSKGQADPPFEDDEGDKAEGEGGGGAEDGK